MRLLHWSALLHEMGMVVSQTGYHKHAAYMIENADLPGFTRARAEDHGRLMLAQKGNLRKLADALADPDFAKAVLALRLAILLMHARIEAGAGELRLRMKNRIDSRSARDWLARHPTLSLLDREGAGVVGRSRHRPGRQGYLAILFPLNCLATSTRHHEIDDADQVFRSPDSTRAPAKLAYVERAKFRSALAAAAARAFRKLVNRIYCFNY